MIKGVIFDLDHTLFDRYATLRTVLPEMYKRLRDSIPSEFSIDDFIEKFIYVEKQHIYNGWNYTAQRMIEQGVFLSETNYKDIVDCLCIYCWPIAAVKFPFAEPMLVELRKMGLKIGILTNGRSYSQRNKIRLLDIEPFVDEIVICADLGVQKPDPKPFEVMSEKIGIEPQELLFVGDNPLNDVEASRNAGYTPVWVKTVGHWYFDDIKRCELEVETVAEIPDIVKKLNQK